MQSMLQLFHFNFSWLLVSGCCWCAIVGVPCWCALSLRFCLVWHCLRCSHCWIPFGLGASSHSSRVCTATKRWTSNTLCVECMTHCLPIATRFMGLSNRLDSFAVCPGQRTHTRRGQAESRKAANIHLGGRWVREQDLLPIAQHFRCWSALCDLWMLSRGRLSETMRKTKMLNVISLLLLILFSICRCTRIRHV